MLNAGNITEHVPTLIGAGRYVGVIKKAEGKEAGTGRFFAKFNILIDTVEKGSMVQAVNTDEVKKSGEPIVDWKEAVDEDTGQVIEPEGEYLNLALFYPKDGDKTKYHDKQMALLKSLLKAVVSQIEVTDDTEVDSEEFVKQLEGVRIGVKVSKPSIYMKNDNDEWVISDYPGNDLQGFFAAE
jgi:hypothetical protein